MTHQEIQEKITELIKRGDWFDIVQICKHDPTDYALVYLCHIATQYMETLEQIKSILKDK